MNAKMESRAIENRAKDRLALLLGVWLAALGPDCARATPMVQAIPLTFLFESPKCHGTFDFACLSPETYLITESPTEVQQNTQETSVHWGVLPDMALVFPKQAKGLLPLFRYYNPKTKDHFFTTDQWEGGEAIKWLGYTTEGVCCYVAPSQLPGTAPLYRFRVDSLHQYQLAATQPASNGAIAEGIAGYVWTVVDPAPMLQSAQNPPSTTPNVPKGKVAATALFELRSKKGDHALITANPDEDYELRNVISLGWTGADPAYAVFPPAQQAKGTTALLRYQNPKSGDHFFTTDTTEGANAINTYKYVSEDICCYVSATPASGTVAVHRLLKGSQHLFVISGSDIEAALSQGYKEESPAAFYVWPLPAPGAPLLLLSAQ